MVDSIMSYDISILTVIKLLIIFCVAIIGIYVVLFVATSAIGRAWLASKMDAMKNKKRRKQNGNSKAW
jgi:hypothetical protein